MRARDHLECMRLTNIYSERELDDEDEALFHHVSEEALEFDFEVHLLPADEVSSLTTPNGDMTVLEAMDDFGEDWQHALVTYKRDNFDDERVVLIDGDAVIDGNHHVVAAYQSGRELKFIQLEDALRPSPPSP